MPERVPFGWLADAMREDGADEDTIAWAVQQASDELPAMIPCSALWSPYATFACCPMCSGEMLPEHAHYRCGQCGWRDSCCD